jgi:hypothetical protein
VNNLTLHTLPFARLCVYGLELRPHAEGLCTPNETLPESGVDAYRHQYNRATDDCRIYQISLFRELKAAMVH